MSHIYKTIMTREGFDFDYVQNRHNSKQSQLVSVHKKLGDIFPVAIIDNKTGDVKYQESLPFKTATIKELKSRLNGFLMFV